MELTAVADPRGSSTGRPFSTACLLCSQAHGRSCVAPVTTARLHPACPPHRRYFCSYSWPSTGSGSLGLLSPESSQSRTPAPPAEYGQTWQAELAGHRSLFRETGLQLILFILGFPPFPHSQETWASQVTEKNWSDFSLFPLSPTLWTQLLKFKCQDNKFPLYAVSIILASRKGLFRSSCLSGGRSWEIEITRENCTVINLSECTPTLGLVDSYLECVWVKVTRIWISSKISE